MCRGGIRGSFKILILRVYIYFRKTKYIERKQRTCVNQDIQLHWDTYTQRESMAYTVL